MNISSKGKYGLRALCDMAQHESGGAVAIASIAKRQNISEGYLEQIMAKLKKAGIVRGVRGPKGGYILAKNPEELTCGEILRVLEGDKEPVECAGLDGSCPDKAGCATKKLWKKINDNYNEIMDAATLASLIDNNTAQT